MAFSLNPAQQAALSAITRQRQVDHLGAALAEALPDVHARLGDRRTALLALLTERAAQFQLTHLGALARYLVCWCCLGAEFERRPEHQWALAILQRKGQSQGSRIYQLVNGVTEALRALGSNTPLPADTFLAAVACLDVRLAHSADFGSLQAPWLLELGPPCDIDRLLARLLPDEAHQWYVPAASGVLRLPPAARPERCEWPDPTSSAAAGAPPVMPWPDTLTVLAGFADEAQPATLGLHSACGQVCDAGRHPLIRMNSAAGVHERRGEDARLVSLRLYASRDSLACLPDGRAGIAIPGDPVRQSLEASACGLRLQGASLGYRATALAIYPRCQWLLTWQRSARPPLRLPDAAPAARAPAASLALEQDGVPLDQPDWTAQWANLEPAWLAALERLQGAWERGSGLEHSVLEDASGFLLGQAALTWGWAYGRDGLAGAPRMRMAAHLQMLAARVQLRLHGQFLHQGARCDLTLAFTAEYPIQCDWQSPAFDALKPEHLAPLAIDTMVIGTLQATPHAGGEGTLVCRCLKPPRLQVWAGLGAHAAGPGLQWRVGVQLAPVEVEFLWTDPLLGTQALPRTLLPQTSLLAWTLP